MLPMSSSRLWAALLVPLALLATACPGDGPCAAGTSQACTCKSGGSGTQVCDAQGAWGDCDCSGGTGGGAGGGGGSTGSATVTGTVTYDFVPSVYTPGAGGTLQFAAATQRPVRGGVIQVVQGTTTLGTATTADDGTFSVSFTPSASGALTLFALSRTTTPSIQVQDNTGAGTPVWAISTPLTGASQAVTLRATHGWNTATKSFNAATRTAAPFAILDSMLTATRAFTAARPGLTFPALKCNWSPNNVPQAGDKTAGQIGTSSYSFADNQLYILGKDQVDTDEFDSHVIVHEWGHFFEANLSRSDSPGGQHGSGDVLDPRIAFGEAWGNAVASMVLPESTYSDTSWTGAPATLAGFGFDLETAPAATDDPTPSGFSEFSVMRFLYDLFDSGANEGFDTVALGLGPIVEVMVGPEKSTPALTTVASFVTGLKATTAGGAASAAIDTLAGHYNIGAITSIWGDGDPGLRGMYTDALTLPFTSTGLTFTGGARFNSYQQNQYFRFTGTGGNLTATSTASQDVDLKAYRSGVVVQKAETGSGNETMSFTTTSGATYVLVVTGFGTTAGEYAVTVGIHP